MKLLTARVLEWLCSRLLDLQRRLDASGERQPVQLETEHSTVRVVGTDFIALDTSAPADLQGVPDHNDHANDLLYRVAHELKAPLTAIIFSSELLSVLELLDANRDSHKEALIENVSSNARKLNRRMTDLLGFIATQGDGPQIEPQYLEVRPVLLEVASQQLVLFNKKRQTLKLEIPESLPMIRADKARLQHVVANLLEHANEASPVDSTITIAAKESRKEVVVEVRDSPPPLHDLVVGGYPDERKGGNVGTTEQPFPTMETGLAVSKRLIEMQKGKIWMESRGGANTFAFALPVME